MYFFLEHITNVYSHLHSVDSSVCVCVCVSMVPQINMTHLIKHLSFGKDYPGIVNPLDGTDVNAPQGQRSLGVLLYCAQYEEHSMDNLLEVQEYILVLSLLFGKVFKLYKNKGANRPNNYSITKHSCSTSVYFVLTHNDH